MKVIIRAISVCLVFYLAIACAGYFSMLDQTNAIVLDRPSLTGKADIFIVIAAGAIILVLFVAVPVNVNPFRNQIFYQFFNKETYSQKE